MSIVSWHFAAIAYPLSPIAFHPATFRCSSWGWTLDPRFIDDLAKRLSAAVPPGITALRRDLEDNFKSVLQAGLTRLDLVSRQEFDVQAGVLRRTREKLEALEAKVAALENREKEGNRE
jgi:ubiquinone biosynthesis accessory factor UbiK